MKKIILILLLTTYTLGAQEFSFKSAVINKVLHSYKKGSNAILKDSLITINYMVNKKNNEFLSSVYTLSNLETVNEKPLKQVQFDLLRNKPFNRDLKCKGSITYKKKEILLTIWERDNFKNSLDHYIFILKIKQ